MEQEPEGVVISMERRGNYEYTVVKFTMPKAEADKLSKHVEHTAGKISAVAPAEDAGESLVTFKKKVKHLKKGLRK